ncbi:MAG TPA: PEGA domain-containing protein [Patescibacteria group bacterium]|nr:PEGA domain-containing protein [Patescibacteria group bacterium]
MMGRKKLLIIIIVISAVLFVSVFIFNAIRNSSKDTIILTVAPKKSSIIMDAHTVIHPGTIKVAPGNHTINVTYSGFASTEKSFTTTKNQVINVWVALSPNSPVGNNFISSNQNEFLEVEKIAGQEFDQGANQIANLYPIIKKLPYDIFPIFRIDYGASKKYPNNPTRIALYISVTHPSDKQDALITIYDMGYDPSDYEIIFQTLNSAGQ